MEHRTAVPPRTVFTRRAAVAPRATVVALLGVVLPGCGDDGPSDITPIEAAYAMEIGVATSVARAVQPGGTR